MANLLTWLAPHWDSFERLLIIKGPAWVDERRRPANAACCGLWSCSNLQLSAPGTESESVVLSITARRDA